MDKPLKAFSTSPELIELENEAEANADAFISESWTGRPFIHSFKKQSTCCTLVRAMPRVCIVETEVWVHVVPGTDTHRDKGPLPVTVQSRALTQTL